ncbi:U3 small nucleolar ribonucleoprotein complex, subunit Mpp10 [Pyrenochaeta sp. MPI-SDFR-AT-0127]|nr:U3 small nucleolar ribonucleoprotein complex, subunit Mpp10 [Pyrenochaeta sp. MPI-SDFR-AT-0127]
MAPPSFSPDTSISSRTLSIGSVHAPPMELSPASANSPTSLLASPLHFLQPSVQLNASFLAAAKRYLDPIAVSVSESQSQRQQDMRKKRKRGAGYDETIRVLHLKRVHLDGFGVNQVFEQMRKIVEAAATEIELSLPNEGERGVIVVSDENDDKEYSDVSEEYHTDSSLGDESVDSEFNGVDDYDDEAEGSHSRRDQIEVEDGENCTFTEEESDGEPAEIYKPDPHGLNDGFFSIDDFNKQTDFLEQQDQRGEAAESDDDEVDWATDPMAGGKSKTNGSSNNLSEDDEESGPTFGNVDLNAPEGDSDDDEEYEDGDLDGWDDGTNANNVMYADFFAPPARKVAKTKKKRGRPNPHNFPEKQEIDNKGSEAEEIMNGTMARVHRDLFEDDDDVESTGDLSDLDHSDPKSRRSTYERRQAKIAEEIRKLEAANVARREWQLSGEAGAADRPLNSLLEENLEFERAGKPVPIVTAEVSEDIEALIKRRILASDFDEVRRRRPDDLATGPKVRRGKFELDDSKANKGLADMYEEDHLREMDPNFVEAKDERLKKEHDEISGLWKALSAKLDSLSSSHFKPKQAALNLEIRIDAPAIEMEDARPTIGGDVVGASRLAPQELYRPGEEQSKLEFVAKSGMPFSREEMSREEKMSRRRRAKARAKKAGLNKTSGVIETSKIEKKKQEKKQVLTELKKGRVQVIGKKGVLTDIEGRNIKDIVKESTRSYKL